MDALNTTTIRVLSLTALLQFIACAQFGPQPDPAFATVRPVVSQPLPISDGAIFKHGFEMSLFQDQKARRVGDIISIILVENTNASKKATSNTKKDSEIEIGGPTLWGGPVTHKGLEILSASASAGSSFSGQGDSTQSNSLSGTIAVTVTDVLSNGNLMVRGEKLLTLNQGSERVQFSGTVRSSDINPDNSVLSTQVANANINYIGEGAMADANRMGWLSRVLQSPWWPF